MSGVKPNSTNHARRTCWIGSAVKVDAIRTGRDSGELDMGSLATVDVSAGRALKLENFALKNKNIRTLEKAARIP